MIDKVKSTIKNIVDIVKNAITNPNALGIKSPSTVFAGFGENTAQGFINGVMGMAGAVNKAVDSVFGDLGGDISYNATFGEYGTGLQDLQSISTIELPSFTSSHRSVSPAATGQPVVNHNYYSLNVNMDDVDDVVKLKNIFQNFAHNKIVFEGV